MRFIKVNELKLTQVELFSFFHFMCAAANVFELFCIAFLVQNFLDDETINCAANRFNC